jgi:hypothetical protein
MARNAEEMLGAPVKIVTLRGAKPDADVFEIWLDRGLCVDVSRRPAGCGDAGRASAPTVKRD